MEIFHSPDVHKNKKAIITLVIGQKYQRIFDRYVRYSWEQYAKKHELDIIVIDQELDVSERAKKRSIAWQKCLVLSDNRVNKYNQVVWIDSDVVINWENAPYIFENIPLENVAAVDHYSSPSKYVFLNILKRLYEEWDNKNIKYIRNLTPQEYYQVYGLEPLFDKVIQSGVFVFSPQKHRSILEKVYFEYEDKGGPEWNYEMRPLSFELLKNAKVTWLDYRFNLEWPIHRTIHYPFLLDNKLTYELLGLKKKCIEISYSNSFFLHFSGSQSDMQYMDTNYKFYKKIIPFLRKKLQA